MNKVSWAKRPQKGTEAEALVMGRALEHWTELCEDIETPAGSVFNTAPLQAVCGLYRGKLVYKTPSGGFFSGLARMIFRRESPEEVRVLKVAPRDSVYNEYR